MNLSPAFSGPQTALQEFVRGWPQVLTGLLCLAMGGTGIFMYTQGLFYGPLQAEFGWTRVEMSSMSTAFTIALGCGTPFIGMLVDRFGVRKVSITAILSLSLCFWFLSRTSGEYLAFVTLMLIIGVISPGTSGAPYIRLLAAWFEKGRGLAIGIAMTGTGLIAMISPPLLGGYLKAHGWRASYALMAILVLLPLPLVLKFASDRPKVDGHHPTRSMVNLSGLTLKQALLTKRFWILGVVFLLSSAAVVGILPHYIPMLQDSGLQMEKAGMMFGVIGVAVIIGRLITGYLCDHLFAPYVAVTIFSLSALGFLGLYFFGVSFAIMGALLIGLSLGAEIDLVGYMSARYFGLRNLGSILGCLFCIFGVGSGIGSALFGYLYDHFGDYRIALLVGAGVLFAALPSLLMLGPYWSDEPSQGVDERASAAAVSS